MKCAGLTAGRTPVHHHHARVRTDIKARYLEVYLYVATVDVHNMAGRARERCSTHNTSQLFAKAF